MAPINRAGPVVLGAFPSLRPVASEELATLIADGVHVIDARDRLAFATAHIEGPINIELNEAFGRTSAGSSRSGSGWSSSCQPLKESEAEAVAQLIRIGWDRIEGVLAGGVEAWAASGRATSPTRRRR